MQYWRWFDFAFPWIGFVAALALLVALFLTDRLRQDLSVSRWRDPAWLAWLLAAVYLVHNFEEYGIDAIGRRHAFPDATCAGLHLAPYPACVIPPDFYLAVNITAFWVFAPILAILGRRNPAWGLAYAGLILTNGIVHFFPFVQGLGYGPGFATALLLFLPLFTWIAISCFGAGRLPYRVLAAIILAGVMLHVCLIGSMVAFTRGAIGTPLLITIQILNPLWFVLLPWLASRGHVPRPHATAHR